MSATLNSELGHRAEADLSSPALITDLVGLSVHAMKSQSQGSKPRVCGVGFPFSIAILAQPSSDRSSHWYGVRTTSAYQHLISACMTARLREPVWFGFDNVAVDAHASCRRQREPRAGRTQASID